MYLVTVLRSRSRWSRNYYETWSRSRNYLCNKYFLQSVWSMLGRRKANFCHYYVVYSMQYYYIQNSFKWQYIAVAGTGAGSKIMDKGGPGAESKQFQLRINVLNFSFWQKNSVIGSKDCHGQNCSSLIHLPRTVGISAGYIRIIPKRLAVCTTVW